MYIHNLLIFMSQYKQLPAVHALMEAYHNNCEMLVRKRPGLKTMLLIAVEGSKRRSKINCYL